MHTSKKSILKYIFSYASSQYFSQFIGFFTAVFMRKFLGPFNMGVWGLLRVVADYATYTHLGTADTLFYRYPYCKGKGEIQEANNIKNVVFSYITLTSFIAGIGIICYAFLFREKLLPSVFWGLLVTSVFILCMRIYTYYIMLLRVNKDFTTLSLSIIFDAVVNFLLVLILVGKLELKGLFIAIILMPLLNILFIRHFVNLNIKYKFDLNKLWSYIKFGFPLFITGMLEMILQSIDRIMIAKYLGLKALGFYSVALMSRNYSEGVSKNFNVVITPHFLEDYGKTGNITTASKYLKTTAELMSSFMAYLLGLVYIVAPIFVVYVLPDFTQGIAALKYMLLTTFFYTASPQSQHFLIAMNKQSRLIPIACFAIVINIIFNLIFLKHGFGITGVAAATTIASLVVFLISLLYALMHIENITKALKFSILIMSPLFYSAVILLAMEKMRFINPFLEIFIKGALFTLLFLPWVYRINKKTAILNTLKVIIAEKLTQNSFIKKQNDK